jgi:hypothetical protein
VRRREKAGCEEGAEGGGGGIQKEGRRSEKAGGKKGWMAGRSRRRDIERGEKEG